MCVSNTSWMRLLVRIWYSRGSISRPGLPWGKLQGRSRSTISKQRTTAAGCCCAQRLPRWSTRAERDLPTQRQRQRQVVRYGRRKRRRKNFSLTSSSDDYFCVRYTRRLPPGKGRNGAEPAGYFSEVRPDLCATLNKSSLRSPAHTHTHTTCDRRTGGAYNTANTRESTSCSRDKARGLFVSPNHSGNVLAEAASTSWVRSSEATRGAPGVSMNSVRNRPFTSFSFSSASPRRGWCRCA